MRPVRLSVTGTGVSNPVILDQYRSPFSVGVGVTVSAGASLSYTVEHTFDDVFAANFNPATATWFPHASLAARASSSDGNYAYPVMAVRLNVTGTGTAAITIIQAGMPGG